MRLARATVPAAFDVDRPYRAWTRQSLLVRAFVVSHCATSSRAAIALMRASIRCTMISNFRYITGLRLLLRDANDPLVQGVHHAARRL